MGKKRCGRMKERKGKHVVISSLADGLMEEVWVLTDQIIMRDESDAVGKNSNFEFLMPGYRMNRHPSPTTYTGSHEKGAQERENMLLAFRVLQARAVRRESRNFGKWREMRSEPTSIYFFSSPRSWWQWYVYGD